MASRRPLPAPHQQKAPVAGKQQKAVDGNNRRALGDIGNLVNVQAQDGKQQPPRPITRSFGVQLLRNAQVVVDAAAKKPVKQEAVNNEKNSDEKTVDCASIKKELENIIILSSGTRSKMRKKVYTLSSVLTARSKAACGITDKSIKAFHDIDGPDAEDHLAVVDYVEDIYTFYRIAEAHCRPNSKYMDLQVEINAKMRSILADWLIEVHHKFELMPETLYLTLYIIDRYLSTEIVLRRELQLVGVSAMLIACKYEEIWAPEVNDFICISDRAYNREQILAMEKSILNKLEWNLTVPTPYVFLVRFIKAALSDKEMENMVFFLAELGLMYYSMISYSPSKFAAATVYAANCTLNKNPEWSDTLKHHTGYDEEELHECAKQLVVFHSGVVESKFKVVFKKYSNPQRGAVALQPPASKFLGEPKY